MSENFTKMLKSPDKGFHQADGLLTKLLRKIWFDMDLQPPQANHMMMRYLDKYHGSSGKAKSSARSNLIKEMMRPRMTWKTFTECLMWMAPKSVRFEIHMVWSDSVTRVTTLDVGISGSNGTTLESEPSEAPEKEEYRTIIQYVDYDFVEDMSFNEDQLVLFDEPVPPEKVPPDEDSATNR